MMKMLRGIVLCLVLMIIALYMQNNVLSISRFHLVSDRLPSGFNGYKIVHLSDLHSKEFGKGNWILLQILKNIKPDLIVLTGDLINSDYFDEEKIISFAGSLCTLAPVYYVTGNHEASYQDFDILEERLKMAGIHILRNTFDTIERNADSIQIAGIDDPNIISIGKNKHVPALLEKEIKKVLGKACYDPKKFTILLSHRPEAFPVYIQHHFDLVFSGHAHGGLIRLPLVGGIYAPGQGVFPKYVSGNHIKNGTAMVVSRGLGKSSSFSLRIGNLPEVVVTTLHTKNQ